MERQMQLLRSGDVWPWKEELHVSITIYDIPASLVKEFAKNVMKPHYPRGISDAIQDLMRKAVEEEKRKEAHIAHG